MLIYIFQKNQKIFGVFATSQRSACFTILMVIENTLDSQVLPVGKELVFCLTAFRELVSCGEGQSALISIICHTHSALEEFDSGRGHERNDDRSLLNEFEWRKNPPLLCCWTKLLNSVDSNDGLSTYAVEAVCALLLGSLRFCLDRKRSVRLDNWLCYVFM